MRHQRRGRWIAVVAVAGLATVLYGPSAEAQESRGGAVQQRLDHLVAGDGFPGALASVRAAGGRVTDYTAGTGDLATRRPVPRDGQVRIGSNTKTFTAVVVLQLA